MLAKLWFSRFYFELGIFQLCGNADTLNLFHSVGLDQLLSGSLIYLNPGSFHFTYMEPANVKAST